MEQAIKKMTDELKEYYNTMIEYCSLDESTLQKKKN